MSTWRSEVMHYGTLVLPSENVKHYLEKLGNECLIQLEDMNAHCLVRPYRVYTQRIDESQRKLQYIMDTIDSIPGAKYKDREWEKYLKYTANSYEFNDVEHRITSLYDEFQEFTNNYNDMLRSVGHAYEYRELCNIAKPLLTNSKDNADDAMQDLHTTSSVAFGAAPVSGKTLTTICGVVPMENSDRLRRTIHYITRGNVFCHVEALQLKAYKSEYMQDNSKKAAQQAKKNQKKALKKMKKLDYDPNGLQGFVFIFQGDQNSAIYEKVKRAVDASEAREYPWPKNHKEADKIISEMDKRIDTDRQALDRYAVLMLHEIQELLEPVVETGNSLVGDWATFLEQEAATYAAMDLFEQYTDTLRCDVWFPAYEEEHIKKVLSENAVAGTSSAFLMSNGVATQPVLQVPSYFRNTGFTRGYQNFVNTYGVPRYRELNPALITSVTLPFLFGVMYGDVGHGIFVMLFGLMLIIMYEKLKTSKNELVAMMLGGRYMLFMMGCFAIYSGFLYNDILSLGVDLFGTRYEPEQINGDFRTWKISEDQTSMPYAFGFDPVWKGAENELTFLNSFKMKYSIVAAGWHMGLGVLFKGANAALLKDWASFFCEFVPQITFFSMFVLYLDFMIIYKWINPGVAPNLINSIIEFAMMKEPEMILYPGQAQVQKVLLLIMLVCVPWMLIPKPFIEKAKYNKKMKKEAANASALKKDAALGSIEAGNKMESVVGSSSTSDDDHPADEVILAKPAAAPHQEGEEEEGFEFGEEFIHQLIETIEFVLGAVSNTASYLRLWALSLAHQQLAIVFFDMTLTPAIEMNSSTVSQTIYIVLFFGAFAACTFVVMLCMDALECYLHALRLQWVEFQNKFFKADGYQFRAFNYQVILSHQDDE